MVCEVTQKQVPRQQDGRGRRATYTNEGSIRLEELPNRRVRQVIRDDDDVEGVTMSGSTETR